jgi:DNA helicase-2/ATP-dependent DNA helicase PcrA
VVRLGWTHVCVDEFQDTNKSQYDLLRLLVNEEKPNLFVVADDDQIIYQWNGASPEQLRALQSDYQMELVQLPENYRCPSAIINLANNLIIHNRLRTADKKPLRAVGMGRSSEDVIRYGAYSTSEEENSAVAKDMRDRGVALCDCVVLARTTRLIEAAATALRDSGLEAHVTRRKNDFDSPVVRVLFNAMRLANARHDRDLLRRLCIAWKDLASSTMEVDDLAAAAALQGGDFLRSWIEAASAPGVDTPVGCLLNRVRSCLVDRLDFVAIVDWFLAEGWTPWDDPKAREVAEEVETWRELHRQLMGEHSSDALTLNLYLQKIDLVSKSPIPGPNAIRCLTVHGAKGLEFKHVYLIGMAQEVLPSFQALKKGRDSKEMEEERRGCFVAITRVQETLTLTRARQYNGWSKDPSQFLLEMGIAEQTP